MLYTLILHELDILRLALAYCFNPWNKKMRRIISLILIFLIIVCCVLLFFYDIQFAAEKCDILLRSRNSNNCSYGVNYKNGFKLWRFVNGSNGLSTEPVYFLNKNSQTVADLPFKKGEKLVYNVYSAGIKTGRSVLEFHGEEELDGEQVYHISFSTETPFFKDYEEIYADTKTFLPIKIKRLIKKIAGFSENIEENYNQSDFTVDITKKGKLSSNTTTIKKDSPIYNSILLTYYCRANPYNVDMEKLKIVLPTFDFYINMSGEETIETPSGKYDVDVFSSNPSKFTFYLSKDKDRAPVKIQSHTALNYSMVLNSKENTN